MTDEEQDTLRRLSQEVAELRDRQRAVEFVGRVFYSAGKADASTARHPDAPPPVRHLHAVPAFSQSPARRKRRRLPSSIGHAAAVSLTVAAFAAAAMLPLADAAQPATPGSYEPVALSPWQDPLPKLHDPLASRTPSRARRRRAAARADTQTPAQIGVMHAASRLPPQVSQPPSPWTSPSPSPQPSPTPTPKPSPTCVVNLAGVCVRV